MFQELLKCQKPSCSGFSNLSHCSNKATLVDLESIPCKNIRKKICVSLLQSRGSLNHLNAGRPQCHKLLK